MDTYFFTFMTHLLSQYSLIQSCHSLDTFFFLKKNSVILPVLYFKIYFMHVVFQDLLHACSSLQKSPYVVLSALNNFVIPALHFSEDC